MATLYDRQHNCKQQSGGSDDLKPDREVHCGGMSADRGARVVKQAIEAESRVETEQKQAGQLPTMSVEQQADNSERGHADPSEVHTGASYPGRQIRIVA